MKQRAEIGAWRGPAALAVALVYALAVEDLLNWLGPVRFALVSAGVLALMWFLVMTTPHSVRYVAPPPSPVDDGERVGAVDIMLMLAVVLVLAAVMMTVLPCLLR